MLNRTEGEKSPRKSPQNRLRGKEKLQPSAYTIRTHSNTHIHVAKEEGKIIHRIHTKKHVQLNSRAEVNDFQFVCIHFLLFFRPFLFSIFSSYISTAPQYYVILCSIVVHKNFISPRFSLYVFSSCFVFNWDTRALCDSVGRGFARAREIWTRRTDMIHKLMSHGALTCKAPF